LLIKHLLLFY